MIGAALCCAFIGLSWLLPAGEPLQFKILEASGVALSPETPVALSKLYQGQLADSVTILTGAVARNPDDAVVQYFLGTHAVANDEFQKALEHFCKACFAARGNPWGEFFLERIQTLLPYCTDPEPFNALVAKVGNDPQTRMHLRDRIRIAQGVWLLKCGQLEPAAQALKPVQFITKWALIGPFDNRDKSGFGVSYEPELGIDFDKPASGRNRRVAWFRPDAQPLDGIIDLSDLFEPQIHVVAYAVTFLKAETEGWAVLRAGCAGALAIWCNDVKVAVTDDYNDFGPEKLSVPVYLHKGWNKVLFKSGVVEETECGFALRVTRPEGGQFANLAADNSAEALAGYLADAKGRAAPPAAPAETDLGIVAYLDSSLKETPDDVSLLSSHGMISYTRRLGDKESPQAEQHIGKALALAPKCPLFNLQMASIAADNNLARQAAESVVAAHPELPAGLEMLAHLAQDEHLHIIAEAHARQAMDKFGKRAVFAVLTLADALAGKLSDTPGKNRASRAGQDNKFPRRAEAYRLIRDFERKHPYLPRVWRRLAELEIAQSARRSMLQKALTFCGGDTELRALWTEELAQMGKHAEAAEFAAAGLPAQPYDLDAVLNVHRLFWRAGNLQRARQILADARRWTPENPDLLEALARCEHYGGKTPDAIALLRDVLRLKPNSPQVKDYLAQLDQGQGTERQQFATYEIALKDLVMPKSEDYPNDNAVNLLNQEVVRVNANGSASRMVHRIAKVLRPAGIPAVSQHSIYYDPQRQVVDVLRAAVITPDGRELSRADVQDRSTSAAMGVQTRIYDEHHLKVVSFNDLEPGALIDLQYTIRDMGDNIYGDYFADTFHLSDDDPTLRSQYVLDYPKSLVIQTRTFNAKIDAERLNSGDTGREVLKWELQNTPGVTRERGMPPIVDGLAQLQVTTMRSWQEVGQWYWHLAKDQLAVSDDMRQQVAEMTKGCKTDAEKLRAIHDWVIRKIRYLGIEFGRNGYKPHRAEESFKALYGDCKDTSVLITALLQAVKIDSKLVLIRTVDAGVVPPDSLPMPNLFNHCIAYVPNVDGKAYWIDCTTDFHRLGEVPYSDQGAQVLVVGPEGGNFMKVPPGSAQENLTAQTYTAKIERDGSASVVLRDVRHGQLAPGYRELAETPGQYERYLKDFAARRFNGAEVQKYKTAPAHDQGPMWMEIDFKVPALAAASGERLAIPAALEALHLSQRFTAEQKRQHPLELYYPFARKTEINVELVADLKAAALPEEAALNEPFGSYSRKVTHAGQKVTIIEAFEISKQRIGTAEYAAFKAFCNKVDSLQEQKILLTVNK